jgi:hypothetical protein
VASPSKGINSITGEGLIEALTGAQVIVDVTNSPSFEDKAVLEFFKTSTRNVPAGEAETGVSHHGAISIVGSDGLPASGYLRAKAAQEKLIKASDSLTQLSARDFYLASCHGHFSSDFRSNIYSKATRRWYREIPDGLPEKRFSFRVVILDCRSKRFSNGKGRRKHENEIVRYRACCEHGHDCSSEPGKCSRSDRGISRRLNCT